MIAGLSMLALFAAVEYGASLESEAPVRGPRWELQPRAERLAHANASLRFMEDFVTDAETGTGLCGTQFLRAEYDVRAAIKEGLLPPDTHIPELFLTVLQR